MTRFIASLVALIAACSASVVSAGEMALAPGMIVCDSAHQAKSTAEAYYALALKMGLVKLPRENTLAIARQASEEQGPRSLECRLTRDVLRISTPSLIGKPAVLSIGAKLLLYKFEPYFYRVVLDERFQGIYLLEPFDGPSPQYLGLIDLSFEPGKGEPM